MVIPGRRVLLAFLPWAALAGAACGSDSGSEGLYDGGVGGSGASSTGGSGAASGGSGGSSGGGACTTDADCAGQVCQLGGDTCVQCNVNSDCWAGSDCIQNRCVEYTPCQNSLGCPQGLVCVPGLDLCAECATSIDCVNGGVCSDRHCRDACDSDNDCTPLLLLCDRTLGACYDPSQGQGTAGTGGSGGTGAGGSGGGSGGTGGGTGGTGAGGTSGGTGGTGTGGSGGGSVGCTGNDLYILMDRSGSMVDETKWIGSVASIDSFLDRTDTLGLGLGLGVFPVPASNLPVITTCTTDADCGAYGPCMPVFNQCNGLLQGATDSCVPEDYDSPIVAIGNLPTIAGDIRTSLSQRSPNGSSTLRPALEGTLTYLRGARRPGRVTSVVMITDADPSGCTGNGVPELAGVASSGLAQGLRTHVVVLGTFNMDPVAQAGGTGLAKYVTPASAGTGVRAALDAIAAEHACP